MVAKATVSITLECIMSVRKSVVGALGVAALSIGSIAVTMPVANAAGNGAYTVYGTYDCGGLQPEGMWINQAGNSGWASWSKISSGRASWNYNFNNEPYTAVFGCGDGNTNNWETVNYSSASVYRWTGSDWVCNTYQRLCKLG